MYLRVKHGHIGFEAVKYIDQKNEGVMVTLVLAPVPRGTKATSNMAAVFSFKSKRYKRKSFLSGALLYIPYVPEAVGD